MTVQTAKVTYNIPIKPDGSLFVSKATYNIIVNTAATGRRRQIVNS